MSLETRELGRSGIRIPKLMFGCNVFGWTADEPTSFRLLDKLVETGLTAIDTADMYSAWVPGHQGGESETVIGNWLKRSGKRAQMVIATKVGNLMGDGGKGLKPARIAACVEMSLRRLQTDYIDLYQAHVDDAETPLEDTLAAFAKLIEQGKVRAIGASNFTAARLQQALDVSAKLNLPRFETLQPLYNLLERDFETELGPLCQRADVGVIPYYGLAAGFLTGKYRSEADLNKSTRGSSLGKYLTGQGPRVLAALDDIAARLGAKPAQIALAWLMAKPAITAPIASATSLEQLQDLVASVSVQLDADAMQQLDQAGRV